MLQQNGGTLVIFCGEICDYNDIYIHCVSEAEVMCGVIWTCR